MATVIPFKGIRPAKDKVHLVASRSVDTYNTAELKSKLAENPYTFLHIINPDFSDGLRTKPGSHDRLVKVKGKYLSFRNEQILVEDEGQFYYIYQQIKDGNSFTGIIGCSSIDDYFSGIIKIHEQTITSREEKLKQYLEVCDFNAEPVLFSYPDDHVINELVDMIMTHDPAYDFTTTDRVRHKLWPVTSVEVVQLIKQRFEQIPALYIADGHHRSASSALLGKSRREKKKAFSGNEPFNFFLGIYFPESQLKIYDFNRIVKDLNGLSEEQFIKELESKFTIELKNAEYKPERIHNFSLYLNKKWYSLTAKKELITNDPVGSLDASILTNYILSPILGIHDLKTDKRIGFVSGARGINALKQAVDTDKAKAAFGLYPVTMTQLKLIADTNNIMPPKTTWIEPKLRSGLVIYSLSE